MRIVFASGNEGKLREIRDILGNVDAQVLSLKDVGIELVREENGKSFAENSMIKSRETWEKLLERGEAHDTVVMSDDSGLCIDYLNGKPGVHSARFLGHDTDYQLKNRVILDFLRGVPEKDRGAAFRCSITAITEDGRVFEATDELKGRIAYESAGVRGFGYDPIFFLPEYGMTSGQIRADEKNAISHRARVLHQIRDMLLAEGILKLK